MKILTPEENRKRVEKRRELTMRELRAAIAEVEKFYPSLTTEQIRFLRARRAMLDAEQERLFGPLLDPVEAEEESEASYEELKARARELDIEFKHNIKKVDLERLIEEAEANE